jgi:DNA polymerase III delta prime subunit
MAASKIEEKQSWLEKYQPLHSKDFLGKESEVKEIRDYLDSFIENERRAASGESVMMVLFPVMIISAPNGAGKTTLIDLLLKEMGFHKTIPDLSTMTVGKKPARKGKKNSIVEPQSQPVVPTNTNVVLQPIKNYYALLASGKKLSSDGTQFIKSRVAVVIDDASKISNQKDKDVIKALVKMNNKYQKFPIIILSNTKHSKLVNKLKKLITYTREIEDADGKIIKTKLINAITLSSPPMQMVEDFIMKIAQKENLRFASGGQNVYLSILLHSQYDIRRLINILESLKEFFKDQTKPISAEDFDRYCETSISKDIDLGIYTSTRILLNNYESIESALRLYSMERATVPLMIHQNYPTNIKTQYPKLPLGDQLDLLCDISKSISKSDTIDGLIYSSQCWNLQPVHGFYSCAMPSYYISSYPGKRQFTESYVYTQDFNKTSIKMINNKVIRKAQENQQFEKIQIGDFLHIANILRTLIEREEFERLAELMRPYGLNIKDVQKIIKIDKTDVNGDVIVDTAKGTKKKQKELLTGKQKTYLAKLLAPVDSDDSDSDDD